MNKEIKKHVFSFNEDDNGGEQLTLTTTFYANGDSITQTEGVYTNHELTLGSYCNSASFNLTLQLTPDLLRELADELEKERSSI